MYAKELAENQASQKFLDTIKAKLQVGNVTLLYAVKEPAKSHIPTLQEFIKKRL